MECSRASLLMPAIWVNIRVFRAPFLVTPGNVRQFFWGCPAMSCGEKKKRQKCEQNGNTRNKNMELGAFCDGSQGDTQRVENVSDMTTGAVELWTSGTRPNDWATHSDSEERGKRRARMARTRARKTRSGVWRFETGAAVRGANNVPKLQISSCPLWAAGNLIGAPP